MTNYEKMRKILCEQGMDYKSSGTFVKNFKGDEEVYKDFSEDKKQWALKKGFFPGKIELYGLDNENYYNYITDFQYFMLHPLNHHFRIWINDKLTLKYMLNNKQFKDIMPEYYAYVENDGKFTYLMDCPKDIAKNDEFLRNLLIYKKELVLKPNSGASGGFGFMKLEYKNKDLYENNEKINEERLNYIRDSIRNYVITDYVYQHKELSKIWPYSECTLRVIMCKKYKQHYEKDEWVCLSSFARFGTKMSGGTSNLMAGGVGVGFDFATGQYFDSGFRYKKFCANENWRMDEHPDTRIKWKGGAIPNWEYTKNCIFELCDYISSLSYLGLDIVITQEGIKLLEINTLPSIESAQAISGPALKNSDLRGFFENKGIKAINNERLLEAYIQSQE